MKVIKTQWIIVGVIVVLIAGLVVWYVAFRDTNNSNSRSVSTSLPNATKLKTGSFGRIDPIHFGSGTVKILKQNSDYRLEFQDDFSVQSGPDLFVWLVKKQDLGGASGGVKTEVGSYLELGKLASIQSKQQYIITETEYDDYNYAVVIWCKAFGVQFSNAILN